MIELTETESKARLGPQVRLPEELSTPDVDAAVAFAEGLAGRRVVAKASGVAHKTEANLVRVGLGPTDVRDCFVELAEAGDGTVLIAVEVPTELELIVGGVRDACFGPVVTIGAGGISAEAAPDVVAVLAPPEVGEVEAAMSALRIAPLLGAWRGRAPLDQTAFAELIDGVAAVFDDPQVVAVDLNPVSVVDGLPIVLDALVVLDEVTPA